VEPAEVRGDGRRLVPHRVMELQPPGTPYSPMRSRAGIASAIAGACVLVFQHKETLLPLLPDAAGAALVLGGAIYAFRRRHPGSDASGSVGDTDAVVVIMDQGVELELLELFPVAKMSLPSVGGILEAKLVAQEDKEAKEIVKAKISLLGEILAEAEAQLATGTV